MFRNPKLFYPRGMRSHSIFQDTYTGEPKGGFQTVSRTPEQIRSVVGPTVEQSYNNTSAHPSRISTPRSQSLEACRLYLKLYYKLGVLIFADSTIPSIERCLEFSPCKIICLLIRFGPIPSQTPISLHHSTKGGTSDHPTRHCALSRAMEQVSTFNSPQSSILSACYSF